MRSETLLPLDQKPHCRPPSPDTVDDTPFRIATRRSVDSPCVGCSDRQHKRSGKPGATALATDVTPAEEVVGVVDGIAAERGGIDVLLASVPHLAMPHC
jgi:NAD(P)-dependent dehydrogenase (short-subunit alcohol dehydrogenase family)